VGLGNTNITPDSIGPETVKNIMVTRQLKQLYGQMPEKVTEISAVSAGVPGLTGIQSGEIVSSLVRELEPDLLIVIDALATNSMTRLCASVQITDAGIVPGSGVGNSRTEISEASCGIPVLAIGVPTVVDSGVIIREFVESVGMSAEIEDIELETPDFLVTSKDIDAVVKKISKIIAYALNVLFNRDFTLEEIMEIVEQ